MLCCDLKPAESHKYTRGKDHETEHIYLFVMSFCNVFYNTYVANSCLEGVDILTAKLTLTFVTIQ